MVEAKWQDHLQRLAAYLAAGNPWPRTTPGVTGLEKELGGWLRSQRYKFRHGDLSSARADAMDDALPGWLTGRKASAETLPSDDETT
jgi:hypothetical protein